VVDEVLVKMPKLKVLYMQNNEVAKGKLIPSYRKTVIAKLSTLTYLDDRPVFVEDRRGAEAYYRGGIEAERAERDLIKKEEQEK
jgi:dynein assembly factor 1